MRAAGSAHTGWWQEGAPFVENSYEAPANLRTRASIPYLALWGRGDDDLDHGRYGVRQDDVDVDSLSDAPRTSRQDSRHRRRRGLEDDRSHHGTSGRGPPSRSIGFPMLATGGVLPGRRLRH